MTPNGFFEKTMRAAPALLSCAVLLGISSCATFSNKEFRGVLSQLNSQSVLRLSGVYSASPVPVVEYSAELAVKNLFYQLMQRAPKDQAEYELRQQQTPLAQVALETSAISEGVYRLTVSYRVAGKQIEQAVLNAKLRGGMLELDNTTRDCHGVPYVLGGCNSRKVRVGLTHDGSLIVNSAHDNSGALLGVIGSGYSYNTHHIYQRPNNK